VRARTKSVLILSATLLIGIVLGGVISGAIVNRRLQHLTELRRPGGFAFFLEHAIQPEDEEQAAAIQAVLERMGPRFHEILERSHSEMEALRDSVHAELDPILTEEQKERLEARTHMRPGFMRPPGFRGPRPPRDWDREPRRRRFRQSVPDTIKGPPQE
jgi:hypothetical protein